MNTESSIQGFPGVVCTSVIYRLTHDNRLVIEIEASTTAATPLNLAQHSYFNLGGHATGTILDHELTLDADHWTPVNDVQIPTGAITQVADTPMDFTSPRRVGDRIADVPGPAPGGYDHNFVLFGLGPDAKTKVHDGMAFKE